MGADHLPDECLALRLKEHDPTAFEHLYARHRGEVRAHVARIVRDEQAAEDLTQEVFLRVWTRAEQWDGRGPFRAWALRIATNQAINHLRTVRRRRERPIAELVVDDPGAPRRAPVPASGASAARDPQDAVQEMERGTLVRRLIEALPVEKRVVLRLVCEEDLPAGDVAARLGIPEGTVRSRLHSARKWLARAWRDAEDRRWEGEGEA